MSLSLKLLIPRRAALGLSLTGLFLTTTLVACGSKETKVETKDGPRVVRINDYCPVIIPENLTVGTDIECGDVQVPYEEGENPSGFSVAFMRILAKSGNATQPPLFFHEGGPGGSGEIMVHVGARLRDTLGTDRDLVIVAQRGTRFSSALPECEPADTSAATTEDQYFAAIEAGSRQCRKDLERSGYDLTQLSTQKAVNDIDAIRQALEYEKIDFYGISYGVTYAVELARQYPQNVRKLLLDSGPSYANTDVNHYLVDRFTMPLEFAKYIKAQVETRCKAPALGCNALFASGIPDFSLVLQQAANALVGPPDNFSANLSITPGEYISLLNRLHYQGSIFARIAYNFYAWGIVLERSGTDPNGVLNAFTALKTVFQLTAFPSGESLYASFVAEVETLAGVGATGPASTFSPQLLDVVNCLDGDAGVSLETASPYLDGKGVTKMFGADESIMYSSITFNIRNVEATCKAYKDLATPIWQEFRKPIALDSAALILNSKFDGASPVVYAKETQTTLKGSRLVEFECTHHATLPLFDPDRVKNCTSPLIRSYLDGSDVNAVNVSCVCE